MQLVVLDISSPLEELFVGVNEVVILLTGYHGSSGPRIIACSTSVVLVQEESIVDSCGRRCHYQTHIRLSMSSL